MLKIIIHFVRIAIQLVKIFHESLPNVKGATRTFQTDIYCRTENILWYFHKMKAQWMKKYA